MGEAPGRPWPSSMCWGPRARSDIFDGIVSGQGVLSYVDDVNPSLVLTFTGLMPSKSYGLTFLPIGLIPFGFGHP